MEHVKKNMVKLLYNEKISKVIFYTFMYEYEYWLHFIWKYLCYTVIIHLSTE